MHPMISIITPSQLWITITAVAVGRIMDISSLSTLLAMLEQGKVHRLTFYFRMIRSDPNLAMFVLGPLEK